MLSKVSQRKKDEKFANAVELKTELQNENNDKNIEIKPKEEQPKDKLKRPYIPPIRPLKVRAISHEIIQQRREILKKEKLLAKNDKFYNIRKVQHPGVPKY